MYEKYYKKGYSSKHMCSKQELIEMTEKIKNNSLTCIKNYESEKRRHSNTGTEFHQRKLRLQEESERMSYEHAKIKVDYIKKYNTYPIFPVCDPAYQGWPKIRMKACMRASKGNTLNVTELNEDEISEAKQIASMLIDEHIKWLRKELKLD